MAHGLDCKICFTTRLKDIYDAEKQLTKALPKLDEESVVF